MWRAFTAKPTKKACSGLNAPSNIFPAKNSKDCDKKAERLKTTERWNKVRKRYLELKNQFINDINHPSFICYVMALTKFMICITNGDVFPHAP